MVKLKTSIPNSEKIRNIIFDFGGVICDLDIKKTEEKFKEFGKVNPEKGIRPENQSHAFEQLVEAYESGVISSREFRNAIRDHYLVPPSDEAVDEAWNALLNGIPMERINLLEKIRQHYRIFLLSNSNEIHYQHYLEDFRVKSGYESFDDLFEKAYFSFRIHLVKPGKEVFEYVLADSRLVSFETLFIDDTLKHIEVAKTLGITGYHLKTVQGEQIRDLFV